VLLLRTHKHPITPKLVITVETMEDSEHVDFVDDSDRPSDDDGGGDPNSRSVTFAESSSVCIEGPNARDSPLDSDALGAARSTDTSTDPVQERDHLMETGRLVPKYPRRPWGWNRFHDSGGDRHMNEVHQLAAADSRKICMWKCLLVASILLVASVVSGGTYVFLADKEEDTFRGRVSVEALLTESLVTACSPILPPSKVRGVLQYSL
jgi:hypothetical protein